MSDLLSNQVAKVDRFATFLDAHLGAVLDLEQMKTWGDAEWTTVTDLFNESTGRSESVPQSTRRSIVRTLVNRRSEAACDSFESIGTRR
jgi:hypothetical protein